MTSGKRSIRPLLVSVIAMLLAGVAVAQARHDSAKTTKVTGGTTTVALSDAATTALSGAGITVTPIAPATAGGPGSFSFPIAGGRLKTDSFHGVVFHRGGLTLTKGSTTAEVKNLTVVSGPKHAAVFATTGHEGKRFSLKRGLRHRLARAGRLAGHHRLHIVKLLNLTNVTHSGNTLTADATLTKSAAKLLDRKFGTDAFKGGESVGTVTVAATVAP